MVFSSHIFLFYFLPLALCCYYISPQRLRPLVLTLLSYVFYGWWNPWFTLLMLGSTVVDYGCGKLISANPDSPGKRKAGLWISIVTNLSLLGFFKYAIFFATNAGTLMGWFGFAEVDPPEFLMKVILPVGISFYTFQSMSYSIDLYRGDAKPARNFVDFACYVSLFPQLVAGPIVRYSSIAGQLRHREHSVSEFVAGFTRFNYGFAKKIILANPVGGIADACFGAGEASLNPLMAWIGVIAYAFQIYFDFSAYSDMALGLGRMFGFRFPENFRSPYRSKSLTEFWRRWHISLSSFLRDYLYIPLGGNRKGKVRTYINLLLVMVIGGFWHGAQWTFLIWGIIHGGVLAIERAFGGQKATTALPGFLRMGITFLIVLIAWVFFRAENLSAAIQYLQAMVGYTETAATAELLQTTELRRANLFYLGLAAIVTWACPNSGRFLSQLNLAKILGGLVLLFLAERMMSIQGHNPFLYFQF